MSMELAFTNSGDREFQMLTILLEKCLIVIIVVTDWFDQILLCPLVTEV